eukprot:c9507_g1_i2.p1 GENE.c9507_g1_i2~~c9507_g1_i2.p1  ORF type:complete len:244 (+),score=41.77 c9507_g1_i2:105-836(+)
MQNDGITRAVAFLQHPQWSCSLGGTCLNHLWSSLTSLGMENTFQWSVIDRWGTNSLFAHAIAKSVQDSLDQIPFFARKRGVLLFTAPSVDVGSLAMGDTYVQEVSETAHTVMQQLNYSHQYMLAWTKSPFQVSSLEPNASQMIQSLGAQGRDAVVVIPVDATCDNFQTQYGIDRLMRQVGQSAGVRHFKKLPGLNDSNSLHKALVDIVLKHFAGQTPHSHQYRLRCPGCTNPECRRVINPPQK